MRRPVSTPGAPLLTIGMPLHRSKEFVDVVSANIDAVDRMDVEFLVSDRTGLDDSLAVLAERHAADGRVIARQVVDGSSWVQHCNALLSEARGTYFCWMPHDDTFPPGWVDTLLGYLEAEADLLMAFGRKEPVATEDGPWNIQVYRHPPAGTGSGEWTLDDAVTALRRWRGGYAFTGMFRRETAIAHGLFLPRTRDAMDADVAWVFGMALVGRLRYVPEAAYSKRYHGLATHSSWQRNAVHHLSLGRALAGYAIRHTDSRRDALRALAQVADYTVVRLGRGESRRAWVMRGLHRTAIRVRRPRGRPGGADKPSPSV